MARRKQKARRTIRTVGFKRRAKTVSLKPEQIIIPAMIYGAGRKYLSDLAEPITSKVAGIAGTYADELLFGILGHYIAKKNFFGMKNLGTAMLTIEAASVGNQLAGQLNQPKANDSLSDWS